MDIHELRKRIEVRDGDWLKGKGTLQAGKTLGRSVGFWRDIQDTRVACVPEAVEG
jgi:hypothetical protein